MMVNCDGVSFGCSLVCNKMRPSTGDIFFFEIFFSVLNKQVQSMSDTSS